MRLVLFIILVSVLLPSLSDTRAAMYSYVDQFGNISDTPPEPPVEKKIISNQSNQNRVKNNQNFKNHE